MDKFVHFGLIVSFFCFEAEFEELEIEYFDESRGVIGENFDGSGSIDEVGLEERWRWMGAICEELGFFEVAFEVG